MVGWGGDDEDFDRQAVLEGESGRAQARYTQWVIGRGLRALNRRTYPERHTFTPAGIRRLHFAGTSRWLATAGEFRRSSDGGIRGSGHRPPHHDELPRLIEELCTFLNRAVFDEDPIFTAAYALWRLCWIHPFMDGNGRTARALSYIALSWGLRLQLPGDRPVPTRLGYAPRAYVRALESADRAYEAGQIDVSEMMGLIAFYLGDQLANEPPRLPPGC